MTSQSKDITLLVTSFVYVKKDASHFQKGTNIYIWNLGHITLFMCNTVACIMYIHLGNIFSKRKGIATKCKRIRNKNIYKKGKEKKMFPIICYSY